MQEYKKPATYKLCFLISDSVESPIRSIRENFFDFQALNPFQYRVLNLLKFSK